MSPFTIKGWIQLPFALITRIPFVFLSTLFQFISNILIKLSDVSLKIMNSMPGVEYNPKWIDSEVEKQRKDALERITWSSQVRNTDTTLDT